MKVKNRWDGKVIGEFDIAPSANLQGADLRDADLRDADLRNANLRNANLQGANLRNANLRNANLRDADLRDADLRDADLQGANLRNANLWNANLWSADLQGADLRSADLRNANLQGADLRNADLRNADLWNANLQSAKSISFLTITRLSILPDGDIIGWKKAREGIIKLQIPNDAKRSNATGRKCRAEFAIDLAHYDFDGNEVDTEFTSKHDANYKYKVGETLKPDSFDENKWNECSNGIHFFITKEEAEAY